MCSVYSVVQPSPKKEDRSMPERKKISAIIACYRDAPAIPIMHERLAAVFQKIGVDYEIIFVNDCSPDDSREVLADLAKRDPRVTVINHTRNFGSQNAFTSGMQVCTGDACVLLDGDLQDPPELIEAFHQKWQEGYDVVYGVRVKRDATLFLQVAYKAFYRLFRAASYVPMPLDAGDFSLLDRRVVDALNALSIVTSSLASSQPVPSASSPPRISLQRRSRSSGEESVIGLLRCS